MAQDKLSTGWDGTNNGHVLPQDIDTMESLFPVVMSTVLLIFSLLLLTCFMVKNGCSQIASIEKKCNTLAVFYSIGIVAAGVNLFELITNMVLLRVLTEQGKNISSFIAVKCVYTGFSLVVVLSFAIFGWKEATSFPTFPCCFCCCCFTQSKVRQKLIHSFIFASVSYFCFLLLTSICPTFLLIIVYPIKVISTLLFFSALFFCIILAFTFIFSYEMFKERVKASTKVQSQVKSQLKLYIAKSLRWLFCIIPFIALVLAMFVYFKVIINTDYTDSHWTLQIFSSLLPSILLWILGYYGKRRLKAFHEKHSKEWSLLVETEPNTEAKENDHTHAENNNSEKQGDHCELELEQCATTRENDEELTQLIGEQVTVDIEDVNQ